MKQGIFWTAGLALVMSSVSVPALAHEPVSYQLFKKAKKSSTKKKSKSGYTASRSSGASYRSCAAARAAGAAPLRRGQAGYSRSLDRDGDGIACEK